MVNFPWLSGGITSLSTPPPSFTPNEGVYGITHSKLQTYILGLTPNQTVDELLKTRDQVILTLKTNLLAA